MAAIWPSPESIVEGWFFFVGASTLAAYVGILQALALPLGLVGVAALTCVGYLATHRRQGIEWRYACVAALLLGLVKSRRRANQRGPLEVHS
jgi:hypothetical protein